MLYLPTLLILLLVSPFLLSFPSVPLYCKRFRGDCSIRKESICCKATNIKQLTTAKRKTNIKPKPGKDLSAISKISEKPEQILPPSTTVSTVRATRSVPRFCKLLKFDCKKRSNLLCCAETESNNEKAKTDANAKSVTPTVISLVVNENKRLKDKAQSIKDNRQSNEVFLGNRFTRKNLKTSFFSKHQSLSSKSSSCDVDSCRKAANKSNSCCDEDSNKTVVVEQNKKEEMSDPTVNIQQENPITETGPKRFEASENSDTETQESQKLAKQKSKSGYTADVAGNDVVTRNGYLGENVQTIKPQNNITMQPNIHKQAKPVPVDVTDSNKEISLFDSIMSQLLKYSLDFDEAEEEEESKEGKAKQFDHQHHQENLFVSDTNSSSGTEVTEEMTNRTSPNTKNIAIRKYEQESNQKLENETKDEELKEGDETSLFDSILSQLLSFDINSLQTTTLATIKEAAKQTSDTEHQIKTQLADEGRENEKQISDDESNFISDNEIEDPDSDYTLISLPGYSDIRQPMVLQYPGKVTATITRVSKSYSWQ